MASTDGRVLGTPPSTVRGGSAGAGRGRLARRPLSRARIDRVISLSAALFGLAFGAQTLPVILSQLPELHSVRGVVAAGLLYAAFVLATVAALARRAVRAANVLVAAVYLLVLVTWPLTVIDGVWAGEVRPWPWFLCTVATGMAAVALRPALAAAYLVIAPALYTALRISPAGGSSSLGMAALDGLYAIALGGALLIIVVLLRTAATEVDTAQADALARYTVAVRQHATELERVQVDSIVHDAVLTTFISVARATTPETQELAAGLAQRSIEHVRSAAEEAPDDESVVGMEQFLDQLIDDPVVQVGGFEVRRASFEGLSLPTVVADALASATSQAMVNSIRHGGEGALRWLNLRQLRGEGIRIEVGDTGIGFDPQTIPGERMGVRVSIIERVHGVGGRVEIDSAPGEGAEVALEWPAEDTAS